MPRRDGEVADRPVHKVGAVTDPRATAAAAQIHERAPDLADEPTERLVHDYLDAAEPHDLATLSADDVGGGGDRHPATRS